MSTDEEIAESFNEDIQAKSKIVLNKFGIYPFLNNMDGFNIEHIHDLSEDDLELLAKILDCDSVFTMQKSGGR